MSIEYDTVKNTHNIKTRGIDFTLASEFEFETALIWEDVRRDYSE